MDRHEIMKKAQRLANESPFAPGHIKRWNELEDELLGKLNIKEADELRAHCEAMPCMGAGVILSMLPD